MQTRMLTIICCGALLAVACVRASVAQDVGVSGAQFLKIGPGARGVALGGAYSAVSDDAYAAYWNPAGFAGQEKRNFVTTYASYLEDMNYGFAGFGMPLSFGGSLGVSVTYLGVSDIEGRTADTDAAERNLGAQDICVGISYAYKEPLGERVPGLDLGATVKGISQKIDDSSAGTAALDVGMLFTVPDEPVTIACVVQNLGPGQKFEHETDPLPLMVSLGGAYEAAQRRFLASAQFDQYVFDQKLYAGMGCEYWVHKILAIRAGYRYGYDRDSLGSLVGLAGGVSVRAFNVQFDYAFQPFGDLGDTHRISFGISF